MEKAAALVLWQFLLCDDKVSGGEKNSSEVLSFLEGFPPYSEAGCLQLREAPSALNEAGGARVIRTVPF